MIDSIIDNNWKTFATKINGEIFAKPATSTSFTFDNNVQIKTQNEIVNFIWADQPEKGRGPFVTLKTIFSSPLSNNYSETLKIYKRDFFSSILTMFKTNKTKIGDLDIDNKYIFFSSDKTVLNKLLPGLKYFTNQSKFTNFVVDIEIVDLEKFIYLQVNDLIVDEKELSLFYKFGQDIRNSLNNTQEFHLHSCLSNANKG